MTDNGDANSSNSLKGYYVGMIIPKNVPTPGFGVRFNFRTPLSKHGKLSQISSSELTIIAYITKHTHTHTNQNQYSPQFSNIIPFITSLVPYSLTNNFMLISLSLVTITYLKFAKSYVSFLLIPIATR